MLALAHMASNQMAGSGLKNHRHGPNGASLGKFQHNQGQIDAADAPTQAMVKVKLHAGTTASSSCTRNPTGRIVNAKTVAAASILGANSLMKMYCKRSHTLLELESAAA